MSQAKRVVIDQLPSGVPGLDLILGGGVPEGSFNLIAGAPGTGKTTLAQQFVFANAGPERTALSSRSSVNPRPRCCATSSSTRSSTSGR